MSDNRKQLVEEILETMGTIRGSFHHGHRHFFAHHHVGMPHIKLVLKAADDPKGVTVTELADSLHVTPGAVTQFLDRLVDKHIVERFEDPEDRRVVRIKLAPRGKSFVQRMRKFHFDRMTNIFANLTDADLAQLSRIIKKIKIEPRQDDCRHRPGFGRPWHGRKWLQTKTGPSQA